MLCGCTKLAVGCTVLLLGTGCADRETAAWENLQKDASAEAYRSFLNEFPNGTHASAAQEGIAWIDAKSLNSMTAYDEFLAKIPEESVPRRGPAWDSNDVDA